MKRILFVLFAVVVQVALSDNVVTVNPDGTRSSRPETAEEITARQARSAQYAAEVAEEEAVRANRIATVRNVRISLAAASQQLDDARTRTVTAYNAAAAATTIPLLRSAVTNGLAGQRDAIQASRNISEAVRELGRIVNVLQGVDEP